MNDKQAIWDAVHSRCNCDGGNDSKQEDSQLLPFKLENLCGHSSENPTKNNRELPEYPYIDIGANAKNVKLYKKYMKNRKSYELVGKTIDIEESHIDLYTGVIS